jgi:hypothetical protein
VPAGGLDGSPARKQQRKKPTKKDRRRVSFAPDPELTLIHHFVKVRALDAWQREGPHCI